MSNQTVNVKIEVEARTAAANANLDKTAKSAEGAKTQTVGLNKELANYEKAAARATKAAQAQGKGVSGLTSATANYEKAATRLAAGNDKMGRSFAGAAKSVYASKDGFLPAVTRSTTKMQELGGILNSRIAQLGPTGLAGAAVGAAIAIDQMSQRSLRLRDVQGALKISIDAAREASNGLIDDFTLQQNAVTAVRFGIAKTDKDYAKLVKTATLLARTTGQDSTKAVEDLTTALARQSPMILDNLGLQVNVEAANKAYARTLNKTASQLTEAEKKQAFFNAAMADAEKKTAGLTVTTDGWAVKVQQLKTELLNTLDAVIQFPENLSAFRKELEQTGVAGEAASTALEIMGRIGLGVLTAGLSEAIPLVIRLKENFADLRELAGVRGKRGLGLGDALKDAIAAKQQSDALLGLTGSAVQANLLNATAVGNAKFQEEERKRRRKGGGGGRKDDAPGFFEAADGGIHNKAEQERLGKMQRRFSGQDEGFDALDEQFEKTRDEFQKAREKAEEELHENRKLRIEEEREWRKKSHEDEVARQEEMIERQEAAGAVAGETVAGLAQAWLAAGDLSMRGFKKVLAAWGKAEAIRLSGVAISQGVMALVAAAFQNYPQAAQHLAAAGAATAGAVAIAGLTAAAGGFGKSVGSARGNGSGFGGDAFGGGSGSGSSSSSQPGPHTQSDQLPTAGSNTQHANAVVGSGRSAGGTTIIIQGTQVLGAVDETTGMKLYQGVEKAKRKLGKLG